MFRMKRTLCLSLVLLLGVLLSPLPATAGSLSGGPSAASWDGLWAGFLAWLGLGPAIERSSPYIDPLGGSESSPPIDPNGFTAEMSSAMVDPDGQGTANSSPYIDPDGKP
jgi:hypothetical protein